MLRINGTALLFTLALGLGASGCADNESTLFIEGVLNTASSDCVASPDPEAEFISVGYLDTGVANDYIAAVQVGNQLTQQGNREKLRTETSRIHLEGARGTVFTFDGVELDFEAIGSGFVHPAAGTEPGLAAMFVTIVTSEQIPALRDAGEGQIVVRFRVYGTSLGGKEIESGEFDFPLYICNGCLIDYPPEADVNPDPGVYLCGAPTDDEQEEKICALGQDQRFPCTACFVDICETPANNPWYN